MQAAFLLPGYEAERLFADIPCLQGMIRAGLNGRGSVWACSPRKPQGAVLTAGDFLICGGQCGPWATRLLHRAMQSEKRDWLAYAPGAWLEALGRVGDYTLTERWAFDHAQPEDGHLQRLLASMPAGITLQPIEGKWIARCRGEGWSRDFVHEYHGDGDYAANGLGMLAVKDGAAVSGASAYLPYPGGVEIQVETRAEHRRQGYAMLACAGLILAAHARGLAATWDAAGEASACLAEKLGYRRLGRYLVAEMRRSAE